MARDVSAASTTLAVVDALLMGALTALVADPQDATTPLAYAGRWAGEVSGDSIREVCAQYPSALLRYDGATVVRDVNAVEGIEDRALDRWTVLVCVEEPREMDATIAATDAGAPGPLALLDSVIAAVNGIVFNGAWKDRRTRVAEYGVPVLVRRGVVYVYGVRVEALRVIADAPLTVDQAGTAQDFDGVDADVNVEDTDDVAPNPLQEFTVSL